MRLRLPVVLVALSLTVLALRAVAGHDRFAGPTLIGLTAGHGIDLGDLPVVAVWLVGIVACAVLWMRG